MNCQLLNFTLEIVMGVMWIAALFVGFLLWRFAEQAAIEDQTRKENEMNDHAQELAQRVAEKYSGFHIAPFDPGYRSLMALIANELQAGGWKPGSVWDPYPTNTMSPHSGYAKQTNEAVTLAKQANPSADIGFISNT